MEQRNVVSQLTSTKTAILAARQARNAKAQDSIQAYKEVGTTIKSLGMILPELPATTVEPNLVRQFIEQSFSDINPIIMAIQTITEPSIAQSIFDVFEAKGVDIINTGVAREKISHIKTAASKKLEQFKLATQPMEAATFQRRVRMMEVEESASIPMSAFGPMVNPQTLQQAFEAILPLLNQLSPDIYFQPVKANSSNIFKEIPMQFSEEVCTRIIRAITACDDMEKLHTIYGGNGKVFMPLINFPDPAVGFRFLNIVTELMRKIGEIATTRRFSEEEKTEEHDGQTQIDQPIGIDVRMKEDRAVGPEAGPEAIAVLPLRSDRATETDRIVRHDQGVGTDELLSEPEPRGQQPQVSSSASSSAAGGQQPRRFRGKPAFDDLEALRRQKYDAGRPQLILNPSSQLSSFESSRQSSTDTMRRGSIASSTGSQVSRPESRRTSIVSSTSSVGTPTGSRRDSTISSVGSHFSHLSVGISERSATPAPSESSSLHFVHVPVRGLVVRRPNINPNSMGIKPLLSKKVTRKPKRRLSPGMVNQMVVQALVMTKGYLENLLASESGNTPYPIADHEARIKGILHIMGRIVNISPQQRDYLRPIRAYLTNLPQRGGADRTFSLADHESRLKELIKLIGKILTSLGYHQAAATRFSSASSLSGVDTAINRMQKKLGRPQEPWKPAIKIPDQPQGENLLVSSVVAPTASSRPWQSLPPTRIGTRANTPQPYYPQTAPSSLRGTPRFIERRPSSVESVDLEASVASLGLSKPATPQFVSPRSQAEAAPSRLTQRRATLTGAQMQASVDRLSKPDPRRLVPKKKPTDFFMGSFNDTPSLQEQFPGLLGRGQSIRRSVTPARW